MLRVGRADLDDVGICLDEVERFVVNGFGEDAEAVSGANFRKNLEALLAETLYAVGRSAGLVSASAEEARAGFFHAFGAGQALLSGFNGAPAVYAGVLVPATVTARGGRGDLTQPGDILCL